MPLHEKKVKSTFFSFLFYVVLNMFCQSEAAVQMFFKNGALKDFAIITEEQLRWSLFLIKLPATLF